MRVFVLLFNARTENEGIHTLKLGDRDIVLMFESEDDATRFSLLLEAQDFGSAIVEEFDAEEIEDFCLEAGYEGKLVPEGTLMIPPEASVEATDWRSDAQKMADLEEPPELSSSELDRIRRKLEGLL
jgi:uncharacterized protein with GYD domain